MADYPYTTVPGKIPSLLEKIREVGIPKNATGKWLKSIGFTSSNDTTLLSILKFIEFTDQSGTPKQLWSDYRGGKHGQVLASAIKDGYSELFAMYPDANSRSASELENVISTSTSAGKQAINKTVRTFQNLCEKGEFSASGGATPPSPPSKPQDGEEAGGDHSKDRSNGDSSPSLHIDIQVHISPDADSDQIDKIFESMASHLYKKVN